jgi:hypothetical protein
LILGGRLRGPARIGDSFICSVGLGLISAFSSPGHQQDLAAFLGRPDVLTRTRRVAAAGAR